MKWKKTKIVPVKKVSRDFCGECELRQLPKDTYFRIVRNGKVGKETYTKGRYDYAEKPLTVQNIQIFGETVVA